MHSMQGNQILKLRKFKNYNRHVQDVKIRFLPRNYVCLEMEFLDLNLTKHSMLFTVPSAGGFYRKPYFTLVLKIQTKNPRNKKTRLFSWIAFCRTRNARVENQSLCPKTLTKNADQEFHLCKSTAGSYNWGEVGGRGGELSLFPESGLISLQFL